MVTPGHVVVLAATADLVTWGRGGGEETSSRDGGRETTDRRAVVTGSTAELPRSPEVVGVARWKGSNSCSVVWPLVTRCKQSTRANTIPLLLPLEKTNLWVYMLTNIRILSVLLR